MSAEHGHLHRINQNNNWSIFNHHLKSRFMVKTRSFKFTRNIWRWDWRRCPFVYKWIYCFAFGLALAFPLFFGPPVPPVPSRGLSGFSPLSSLSLGFFNFLASASSCLGWFSKPSRVANMYNSVRFNDEPISRKGQPSSIPVQFDWTKPSCCVETGNLKRGSRAIRSAHLSRGDVLLLSILSSAAWLRFLRWVFGQSDLVLQPQAYGWISGTMSFIIGKNHQQKVNWCPTIINYTNRCSDCHFPWVGRQIRSVWIILHRCKSQPPPKAGDRIAAL